uniref:Uncharacterized protein n=1 Tax=Arundo donax TaxID=35708 RepID=A0A0A8Z5A6_ARUDO
MLFTRRHGHLDRIDRSVLIPRFVQVECTWTSPVKPSPNLRLGPLLPHRVVMLKRLSGGSPVRQSASTERPFLHLCCGDLMASSCSRRLVPAQAQMAAFSICRWQRFRSARVA